MAHLLIENGIVVNSIVPPVDGDSWTPPDGMTLIEAIGEIGDSWDGTKIIPKPVPPAPPMPITFTPRQFIETLFTPAEQQAIFTAAQQPSGWQIAMFISLVSASPSVSLSDPELIKDIGVVQAAGILTAPRAAQILAGIPA
jgi:hypothetical protein